jgi:hypothetical protein
MDKKHTTRRRMMKAVLLVLMLGVLFIGVNLYAADGDLIVNGKVGIGTTSPQAKLQVEGSGFFRGDTGALSSSAGKGVRVFYATNYDAGEIFAYDYSSNTIKNLLIPYGDVAIGTTNPAGYKLYVSGSAYASSVWYSSDMKFKKDITPIESALSKVLKINGVSFTWKTKDYAKKEFPEGKHYGVIAQDIEKVIPEVVKTVKFKYKDKEEDVEEDVEEKAVAYNELIPILIEAIKEQEQKIERLEAAVAALTPKK